MPTILFVTILYFVSGILADRYIESKTTTLCVFGVISFTLGIIAAILIKAEASLYS
jgi:hypothetical protein